MANPSNGGDAQTGQAREQAEAARGHLQQAGSEARQAAAAAASGLSQKAQDAASGVAERAKDLASNVGQRASDVAHKAEDKADDALSSMGQRMSSMAGSLRQSAPRAGVVGSAAGAVADRLESGGRYLQEHGVKPADFNSYGSRRGNHEVMVRGTFANVRLRNKLVNVEGGFTRHLPTNQEMSIFDASQKYIAEGTPLIILAGKEYGSGSSRDWAAKGPLLLGVQAVIAESYERIHRSNLVGMGILPLQFEAGQTAESLKLTGEEVFEITGIRDVVERFAAGRQLRVRATSSGSSSGGGKDRPIEFDALVRIDTPQEALYYANGGILQYVLRQLLAGKPQPVGV